MFNGILQLDLLKNNQKTVSALILVKSSFKVFKKIWVCQLLHGVFLYNLYHKNDSISSHKIHDVHAFKKIHTNT